MENNNITVNMENLSQDERELLLGLIEKANKKESKVWKPRCEERYYCIDKFGRVKYYTSVGDEVDKIYEIGNCFKTKEEAEFALERQKVITELKRFALENNEHELDWNNFNQNKFEIFYDVYKKIIDTSVCTVSKRNAVYFSSRKITNKAIVTIGEDRLKKYYFEIGE